MLTIRSSQQAVFDDLLRDKFAEELRVALLQRYPHCLACFPAPVQTQMVFNMLGRARRQGITWQSALVAFAELMLAVAPNFDLHPAVKAVFAPESLDPNKVMLSLDHRLSKDEWKSVAAHAQDLPLFVPPKMLGASLLNQTTAAIPLALGDKIGAAEPHALATTALALAANLNLGRLRDGGLVLTAWRLFYGPKFRDAEAFPWVADIFDGSREPEEILAMLKYRISLDHGRFI